MTPTRMFVAVVAVLAGAVTELAPSKGIAGLALAGLQDLPPRCRLCSTTSSGEGGSGTVGGLATEVGVFKSAGTIDGDGGLVFVGGALGVDATSALDPNSLSLQLGDKAGVNAYALASVFQGTGLEKVFGFNNSDNSTGLAAGVTSYLVETTPLDSFGEYTPYYGEIHASSTGASEAFIYGADLEVYADHDAGNMSTVAGLYSNVYNNKAGEVDTVEGVGVSAGISHNGNSINIYGGNFAAFSNPGQLSGVLYGLSGTAELAGASDGGGDVAGVYAKGWHQDSAVTVGNIYGIDAVATSNAASTGLGTSNKIVAGRFTPSNNGSTVVGEISGLHVDSFAGTGGATNAYGVFIDSQASGTATNKYAWLYNSATPTFVDSSGNESVGGTSTINKSTANYMTLAGAASGSKSGITVASADHSAGFQVLVDNDMNHSTPAFFFNTTVAGTGSATAFDVRTNNSSIFSVDRFGSATIANNFALLEGAQFRLNGVNNTTWISGVSATHNLAMQSNVTNASTNNAYVMDTANALNGSTSLLVLKNATVQKLAVDNAGNLLSASHLSCAMSAGTTCTATVPAGSICMCQATAGSASALSCAVASTTATCTASGSNSSTWNIFVW